MSPDIITSFADIFTRHIDFLTETKKDDAFKIVGKIKNISKKLPSRIIAVQYKTFLKTYNTFYFKTKNAINVIF